MIKVPLVDSEYMRPLAAALLVITLAGGAASASASPTLVIKGAGLGHGVGMSQDGALGFAEHGYTYQQILAHYYTGTALGRVSPHTKVRVLIGSKVHTLPLETYVRGVVGAEMPSGWPLAALEAQAVASRTYALTDHVGGTRFDVYADTRSQVYLGVKAHSAQTDAAVAATAGEIVTYGGRPAITYFFASSGGMTESIQNAFLGSAPEPWLRGVPDPYDQGEGHSWSVKMSFAAAAVRLRGLVKGAFRGIEVLRRGYSPRIVSAYVLGSAGRTLVSGSELKALLGLDDSWAYFSLRTSQGTQPEPDLSHYTAPVGAAPEATAPSAAVPPAEVTSPTGGGSATGAPPATDPAGPEGGTTAGSAPSAGEGGARVSLALAVPRAPACEVWEGDGVRASRAPRVGWEASVAKKYAICEGILALRVYFPEFRKTSSNRRDALQSSQNLSLDGPPGELCGGARVSARSSAQQPRAGRGVGLRDRRDGGPGHRTDRVTCRSGSRELKRSSKPGSS